VRATFSVSDTGATIMELSHTATRDITMQWTQKAYQFNVAPIYCRKWAHHTVLVIAATEQICMPLESVRVGEVLLVCVSSHTPLLTSYTPN
jgi:hypothetical protein